MPDLVQWAGIIVGIIQGVAVGVLAALYWYARRTLRNEQEEHDAYLRGRWLDDMDDMRKRLRILETNYKTHLQAPGHSKIEWRNAIKMEAEEESDAPRGVSAADISEDYVRRRARRR